MGKLVDVASTPELFRRPRHPYTVALIDAVPEPEDDSAAAAPVRGEVGVTEARPSGCPFHPRCPIARANCATETPPLRQLADGHLAACHYPGQLALSRSAAVTSPAAAKP